MPSAQCPITLNGKAVGFPTAFLTHPVTIRMISFSRFRVVVSMYDDSKVYLETLLFKSLGDVKRSIIETQNLKPLKGSVPTDKNFLKNHFSSFVEPDLIVH
jgi:hypothetical protein